MKKYEPQKIEPKWQKEWEKLKLHETGDSAKGKDNFMLLAEFPYTSGNLHMGHWFTYSIADIYARYLRMKDNKNVMYPIGFDAFGLPAENAAIKNNSTPEDWTKQNINNMTKQLKSIGASFDWSRVVDTSKPDYYKWTQWIFLKLYEKDLVYRGETTVNWCPKDKTVLANEQVVNGRCDRCDTLVEQRKLTQWMFRITDFADQLIDDLKYLDWPEDTKTAQFNWVGSSEGAVLEFGIKNHESSVKVFTTRPDTLFGATYLVLAPEHRVIKDLESRIENIGEVKKYIEEASHKTELQRKEEAGEKTGVELKGVKAINPANKEEISVWVADYVLGSYGTGAIMAVPAHDERDWEFAKKFNLPIKVVILPSGRSIQYDTSPEIIKDTEIKNIKNEAAYTAGGYLVDSSQFNGMDSEEAKWEITKFVGGEKRKQYRLRDWILSRQRYWGAPIPMVNCSKCGYQPVPEKDIPVKLPKLSDFLPVEGGKSPLARAEKWVKTKCPSCKGEAERETDTMDTFVDSSWYFIRYTDPDNKKKLADIKKMDAWLPVPLYIGGREHNTMHLLYARFIAKALESIKTVNFSEPFTSRRNHGVIMGPDGRRMSKSRGNVIDPDDEVAKYGADTVRMNFAFLGPFDQDYAWNPKNIKGLHRFLSRVWNLIQKASSNKFESKKYSDMVFHKAIKKIGEDIQNLKFNTAVSGLMKLLNDVEDKELSRKELEIFLKLLAPFAPHLAEELWREVLGNKKSIHLEKWPEYDPKLIKEEKIKLVIQVNGRARDVIEIPPDLAENEVRELALASEKIKKHIAGKEVKKFIYVPSKIVNIVV